MSDDEGYTHFGYERVREDEKARRVADVFDSVAERYDLMNDLMSFGVHRLWKRFLVETSGARPGDRVLDIAAGSGDVSRLLARRVGSGGGVVLCDVNAAMLGLGRDRLVDAGVIEGVDFVRADAERLPFADGAFDLALVAFGLRNVTRQREALACMRRALRPGGCALVLEFAQLRQAWLRRLYDLYSFTVLPRLGAAVTGHAESYRYLAESIRMHPDQDTLERMMEQAGFERCSYLNLSGGVVALHRGYRL